MRSVKKGDVILITVAYGVTYLIDYIFAREDVSQKDMTDPRAILDTSKASGKYGWTIGPADLYFEEFTGESDRACDIPMLDLPKRVSDRIAAREYCWELRARVQVPQRTLQKNPSCHEFHIVR